MSNAPTQIAPGFKRADPALVNGHPLRGTLRTRQQVEALPDIERSGPASSWFATR